jgi:hypothetical protein
LDKLDRGQDLYICEGIAGTPKIWSNLSKNVCAVFGAAVSDRQVDLLNEFTGRKIVIPDWDMENNTWDKATLQMIFRLNKSIADVYVLPVEADDCQDTFVDEILKKPVSAGEFLLDVIGAYNFIIK